MVFFFLIDKNGLVMKGFFFFLVCGSVVLKAGVYKIKIKKLSHAYLNDVTLCREDFHLNRL